ncbi:alpha amylase, catalytic domain [bacterium BMS3Abin04]|nr:alpha amylase, catalytic domain [bacterium BMS3Abin04]
MMNKFNRCENSPKDFKNEFHIAKAVREKYGFDEELFSITGNVVFANFHAVRVFVQKINDKRDKSNYVRVGEVNAVGLLDEIYHYILHKYEEEENPGVFNRSISFLKSRLGNDSLEKLLKDFVSLFPPLDVYKGKIKIENYLTSFTKGKDNKEIVLEELILLFLANFNPANSNLRELFDENYFNEKDIYRKSINLLEEFYQTEKPYGPNNQPILEMLKTPMLKNPHNLWDQLEFIKTNWKPILEDLYIQKILSSHDLMKEDVIFESFGGGGGAPTVVPKYKGQPDNFNLFTIGKSMYKYALDSSTEYDEPEQFTPDVNWMPNVVLLAKNAFVWLDQLSKKYNRQINRLDLIPDEELDQLVHWNINSLWLIGIWERSSASKRIKHLMGNIDAVASAYSLYDYIIAHDLGGEEAYKNLNERCKTRGIRLASDMVPNHTGIYSKWVIEHPEYFIQSNESPFPNYQFTKDDLSEDPRVQLRIEDKYYERTDAAVVFQRIDNTNGNVTYIYHGNDGTNMPWNDTAQLDLLKKEVREAVIDKIFEVARKFSIIRFDAAMTLTKKHFSRLWYPQPGMGGDIPSRTDYTMSKEQFDSLFPEEFWREVVDRINNELPDTLLLAEAFWLMEGYFVRTLGMHRVYNSAFMNMMKNEENEKYRDLITNTLEFEPEILKRYVNFMSNPDEETAIHQFGTQDKYFGVATLMATLPGLPMFAHGQIEGFKEKYGMEYKRAYYNETPNDYLIERHKKEILSLLSKRYVFSEVNNFWLYDFFTDTGNLCENVFAFTNSFGREKALVFYNNKYNEVSGNIYRSAPKQVSADNKERKLKSLTILEALGIKSDEKFFYIYKDNNSGLYYIRSGNDFFKNGFRIRLRGFEYKVFWNFHEVFDSTGEYKQLVEWLGTEGVPDIHNAIEEVSLQPVHEAFENMFDESALDNFVSSFIVDHKSYATEEKSERFLSNKFYYLLNTLKKHFHLNVELDNYIKEFDHCLKGLKWINPLIEEEAFLKQNIRLAGVNKSIVVSHDSNYKENSIILMMYLVIRHINNFLKESDGSSADEYEKLLLGKPIKRVFQRLGRSEDEIIKKITLLNILLKFNNKVFDVEELYEKIPIKSSIKTEEKFWKKYKSASFLELLNDDYVKAFLNVNKYENIWYFSKEQFEILINWLFTVTVCSYTIKRETDLEHIDIAANKLRKIESLLPIEIKLILLIAKTYYQVDFVKNLSISSKYKLGTLKELSREVLPKNKGSKKRT